MASAEIEALLFADFTDEQKAAEKFAKRRLLGVTRNAAKHKKVAGRKH